MQIYSGYASLYESYRSKERLGLELPPLSGFKTFEYRAHH